MQEEIRAKELFYGYTFLIMRLTYYPDIDSLYIDLAERQSAESRKVSDGIVLDYDVDGNLVGIDIDNASKKLELRTLVLNKLPADVRTISP